MFDSFPWIVSSSTLKTEDLLVSFWETLESLSSSASFPFELSPSCLSSLEKLVGEDSKEEDYKEEEASEALLSLFDLLQEASPPGFYFGCHPGDGALFGFWLSEDWEDALSDCDFFSENPVLCASVIEAAEGFGITSQTFRDSFRGEVSAYSEEEAQREAAKELTLESGHFPRFFDLFDFDKVWDQFYSLDFAVAKSSQSARYFIFNLSNV
jgi:hypothetical protein